MAGCSSVTRSLRDSFISRPARPPNGQGALPPPPSRPLPRWQPSVIYGASGKGAACKDKLDDVGAIALAGLLKQNPAGN